MKSRLYLTAELAWMHLMRGPLAHPSFDLQFSMKRAFRMVRDAQLRVSDETLSLLLGL